MQNSRISCPYIIIKSRYENPFLGANKMELLSPGIAVSIGPNMGNTLSFFC